MRRLASSVLVLAGALTGLVLVSAPAHAALSVTIYASASTVPEGSTVTFTGRAVDARLGSVVRLQRQRSDGSWAVVASRKLVDTRRYRFTTTPPRGYQKYRVAKPAQLGQPGRVSATKTIKVTWRPAVTLGTVKHQVVDYSTGAVTTTTTGKTTRLSAGFELRRELQRSDGTWALHGRVRVASDQTWRDRFSSRHGQRFRYVAPAFGSRLAKASSSFVVDGHWTPTIVARASLDEVTGKATLSGDTTGLSEGVAAQLQYVRPDGTWSDTGPKVSLGADGTYSQVFEPSMTATYRVQVPASGLRRDASSPSFQVAESGPMRVDLNSNISVVFPRGSTQRTLVVAIEEGQTFTYSGPYGLKVNVTDPAGNAMPGFESPIYPMTAIAPSTGDYLITMTMAADEVWENTANVALSKPRVIDTAIDGPATDLANNFRGQLVDLQFDASRGAMISEFSTEYTDVTRQLLDPAGEVVPRFYGPAKLWQIENTGRYTLRFSPTTSWSRSGQEVLSAESVAMTLDGSPAQIHLDRPGRTGVATVDVPAGIELQVSNIDDSNLNESLVSPDRKEVSGSSVPSTQAGTYYQVVSTRNGSADIDYYATTPLEIAAAPGGTTFYDRGPAPHRKLNVAVPVTTGQLLSFEVLDDTGTFCTGAGFGNTATDPIDWIMISNDHPGVFSADESGVIDLDVTPCTATGSIRLTEVTIVKPTLTGSTVDGAGRTVETHEVTVEATQPGQVMVVDYNPGTHLGDVEMRATSSTFSTQTTYSLGSGFPPTAWTTSLGPVPFDRLWTSKSWSYPWRQYYFVYAGATETGTLDLQFTYTHG